MHRGDATANRTEAVVAEEKKAERRLHHAGDLPAGDEPSEAGGGDEGRITGQRAQNHGQGGGDSEQPECAEGREKQGQAEGPGDPRAILTNAGFRVGRPERAEQQGVGLGQRTEQPEQDGERGTGTPPAEVNDEGGGRGLDQGAGQMGRSKTQAVAPQLRGERGIGGRSG